MKRRTLAAVIMLVVISLACGVLPGAETSSKPTATPATVIFQDDFGDAGSGWEVGEYDDGDVGYREGTYFVTSTNTDIMMWGIANRSFDDIAVDVDTTQVSAGPASDNAYGVICREQGNEFADGYYMRISGDGLYSIVKAQGGDFVPLVDWTESDVVKQGNATNHIRAICSGSRLELFVNGQHLATAEDSTFAVGDIAFTTTTYEPEVTEIRFDNLVVSEP